MRRRKGNDKEVGEWEGGRSYDKSQIIRALNKRNSNMAIKREMMNGFTEEIQKILNKQKKLREHEIN